MNAPAAGSWEFVREFLSLLRDLARRSAAGPCAHGAGGQASGEAGGAVEAGGEKVDRSRILGEVYSRTLLIESAVRDVESRLASVQVEEKRVLAELSSLADVWRGLTARERAAAAAALLAKTEEASVLWLRAAEETRRGVRGFLKMGWAWRWALATLREGLGAPAVEAAGAIRRLETLELRRREELAHLRDLLQVEVNAEARHAAEASALTGKALEEARRKAMEICSELEVWRGRASALERETEDRARAFEAQSERERVVQEALKGELERVRKELSSVRSELERSRDEAAVLRVALDASRAGEERLSGRAASLSAELERAREEPAGLRSELERSREHASGVRSELEAARSEQAELRQALGASRGREERLAQQAAELSAELDPLRSGEATAEAARLQAALGALRRENAGQAAELSALREENGRLRESLAEKAAALREAVQASEAELQAASEAAQEVRRAIEAEVKSLREERASLSSALDAARGRAASDLKAIEEEAESLRGELSKAQARLAKLTAELETLYSSKSSPHP
ncbi:MAG: hypothetical protein HY748_09255 [Elusimicrobia bacterium]|nr:hypothetical protein [Elusimicrobiota bacterium]